MAGKSDEEAFTTVLGIENAIIIFLAPIIFFLLKKHNIKVEPIIALYIFIFQILLGGIVFLIIQKGTPYLFRVFNGFLYGGMSTLLVYIFVAIAGFLGEKFIGNIIYLVLICLLIVFFIFVFLPKKRA